MLRVWVEIFFLFLVLLFVQGQNATVFYVNSSSNYTSNCGSSLLPCHGITEGLNAACQYSATNGNVSVSVIVYPGHYTTQENLVSCPITLRSTNGSALTSIFFELTILGIEFETTETVTIAGFTIKQSQELKVVFSFFSVGEVLMEDIQFNNTKSDSLIVGQRIQQITLRDIHTINCVYSNFISTQNVNDIILEDITTTNSTGSDQSILEFFDFVSLAITNLQVSAANYITSLIRARGYNASSIQIQNFELSDVMSTADLFDFLGDVEIGNMTMTKVRSKNNIIRSKGNFEMADSAGISVEASQFLRASSVDQYPVVVSLIRCNFSLWNFETSVISANFVTIQFLDVSLSSCLVPVVIDFDENALTQNITITDCTMTGFSSNYFVRMPSTVFAIVSVTNSVFEKWNMLITGTPDLDASMFSISAQSTSTIFNAINCSFVDNSVPLFTIHHGTVNITSNEFLNNWALNLNLLELQNTNSVVKDCTFKYCNAASLLDVENSYIAINSLLVEENFLHSSVISLTGSIATVGIADIHNNTLNGETSSTISMRHSTFAANLLNATNNHAYFGGVIACIENSEVHIYESELIGNSAVHGGAIYTFEQCHLNILNSNVSDCSATNGGALYIAGDSYGNIKNATFSGNSALNIGGGIVLLGNSSIVIDSVRLEHNEALMGGCLFIGDFAAPQITSTSFFCCNAKTSGGAMTISSYSSPIFNHCTISQNVANSVGAAVIVDSFATPIFNNSLIVENFTPNEGGGMYLQDSAYCIFENITFLGNIAESSAGAMALTINSTALMKNCLFDQNHSGSKGGAIASLNRGVLALVHTTIQNNVAKSGGALYSTDSSVTTIIHCSIHDNLAISRGGAAYTSSESTVTITNSTIDRNTAQSGPGGGLLLQDFVQVNLTNVTISNNFATYGGAVYNIANYSFVATDCIILGNNVTYNGGGASLGEVSISTWTRCVFRNNFAMTGSGGSLAASDTAIADIFYSNFKYNKAFGSGGGISVSGSSVLSTSSCDFEGNIAKNGGAIYVAETAFYEILNSTLMDNIATSQGGGMSLTGSNILIENVMYLHNQAEYGGGVYINYGSFLSPKLMNCSFIENIGFTGGGIALIALLDTFVGGDSVSHSDSLLFSLGEPHEIKENFYIEDNELYELQEIQMQGNIADNGGAVYIDSLTISTPRFGPSCSFINNTAGTFGGAILFGYYYDSYPIVHDGFFQDNLGIFGGANVGFGALPNAGIAEDFCVNCSLSGDFIVGYQDDRGFASIPSSLEFQENSNSCPGQVSLETSTFNISVYLYDQFGSLVQGEYLVEYPLDIKMSFSSSSITLSVDNVTEAVDPSTGAATFANIQLCGPNNATIELKFSGGPKQYTLAETCSILLLGCPNGYQPKETSSDSPCASCIESESVNVLFIVGILLLVIFTLGLILCILIASFGTWRFLKRREKYKMQSLEIPDFTGRPSLTLEDILNDANIPRLPWNEIIIGATIGKGASGLVSSGTWCTASGKEREIALKELILGFQDIGIENIEEFLIEIKYMSALSDDNIVQFIGIAVPPDSSKLYLVTELMHYGSLRDILSKKAENLPWDLRLKLAKDAAKGMVYLHSKKLIHRDLKPENLLVDNEWNCKVADFGISTVNSTITRQMTCIGTPLYMAPEVLSKNKYSEKADVFSFGVVLLELLTGRRPYSTGEFAKMNQAQLMYQIIEHNARPSLYGVHPSLQQLISDCWNLDPRLRPSFAETIVRLRRLKGIIATDGEALAEDVSSMHLDLTGSAEYSFSSYTDHSN